MTIKRIAIIGAGWGGLQIGAILRDSGYDIKLYDQLDDVGGTWHEDIKYYEQQIHTACETCMFYNFENLVINRDPNRKVDARDIFEYCREYAKDKQIYPHIVFNSTVYRIDYQENEQAKLYYKNSENEHITEVFDFVISTQFNSPRMPSFAGQEKFKGQILHSSQIKEDVFNELIKNRKEVVILGASKSATDMAISFAKRNYKVKMLLRKMYWFLVYDKVFYNNHTNKPPSYLSKMAALIGLLGMGYKITARLSFNFLRLFSIIDCPGKKHGDLKKFHFGFLETHQLEKVKNRTTQIYDEIDYITENELVLKSKKGIPCDTLICATGCDPISFPIELNINGKTLEYKTITKLYQDSVIPALPILVFTCQHAVGLGPTRYVHSAAWILEYINQIYKNKKVLQLDAQNQASMYEKGEQYNGFVPPAFNNREYFMIVLRKQFFEMFPGTIKMRDIFIYIYMFLVVSKPAPIKKLEDVVKKNAKC